LNILRKHPKATTLGIANLTGLSRTKVSQIRKEYDLTGDIRVTASGNHKSFIRVQSENKQNIAILDIVKKNPRTGLQ
jgi:hypothetical protein